MVLCMCKEDVMKTAFIIGTLLGAIYLGQAWLTTLKTQWVEHQQHVLVHSSDE